MAKFCSNCGKEINDNAYVCLHCGAKVSGNGFNVNAGDSSQKSKIVAGILGIFTGAFGVHNFYLGYTSRGTVQLLLTVLSCGILSPISGIWAFIEAVQIFTGGIAVDAEGIPLRD